MGNIYNISGGFEQRNIDTVKKIIKKYFNDDISDKDIFNHIDFSFVRAGQDIRYSLDDTKLRLLGWKPIKNFDVEMSNVISYYKNKFIW